MNTAAIFMGVLPLILFVVIDSFSGLKSALISAVIFAVLEVGFSLYLFGDLDFITICSLVLIIVLAGASYYTKSPLHFKLQPVILSAILGLFFLVTFFIGKPVLLIMLLKYQAQLPDVIKEASRIPVFQELCKLTSHYLGYAFLAHAGVTLWAALKLSKWWWIALRGIGFYFFMFLAIIVAKLQLGI